MTNRSTKVFALQRSTRVFALLAAAAISVAAVHYTPKYRITVTQDKRTNYAALRTYAWFPTHPSSLPQVDAEIRRAVEHELATLGLSPAEKPDVLATYASLTRTDVDVKAKPVAPIGTSGARPEYTVGTIVVSLLEPGSLRPILKIRADRIVDTAWISVSIGSTIEEMFRKYPGRRPAARLED